MSKILDMAKDFEQSSKQQANAIEKRLTEEFTRHEKAISGALKSSEEKMSAAIAEHSQKMGWLLLKTWIWMLVSIVLFLSATSGILWYQGN
ncbi:MbeB family mobilization protein [Klebsiella pneumoniae]|uniref:MbeB family mobilization protein n=1 Tax=Klebsiella pneumoniae TaxID=573 RepID=UPI001E645980|nr:MbeB family mobilization protein [Klebsiella pneumoniae]